MRWHPSSPGLLVAVGVALGLLLRPTLGPGCAWRGTCRSMPSIGAATSQQLLGAEGSSVVVFYHVYAMGDWNAVVRDQATKLVFSGLYHAARAIFVGIGAREQQEVDEARELIQKFGSKFTVYATEVNGSSYERLTLHGIRSNTQPSDAILYLHTKGVTRGPELANVVFLWRYVMEYFLIARWRDCLQLLKTHNAVGVNYTPAGSFPVSGITVNYTQHFSGNVWWTTAAHWHSLPEQIGGEYLDPELFLLQREDTTFATLWQPGNDFAGGLYYQEHWPVDYIDSMEVSKVNNR